MRVRRRFLCFERWIICCPSGTESPIPGCRPERDQSAGNQQQRGHAHRRPLNPIAKLRSHLARDSGEHDEPEDDSRKYATGERGDAPQAVGRNALGTEKHGDRAPGNEKGWVERRNHEAGTQRAQPPRNVAGTCPHRWRPVSGRLAPKGHPDDGEDKGRERLAKDAEARVGGPQGPHPAHRRCTVERLGRRAADCSADRFRFPAGKPAIEHPDCDRAGQRHGPDRAGGHADEQQQQRIHGLPRRGAKPKAPLRAT